MEEPLLSHNSRRFVLFPIKHKSIWDFYKKQERAFWTAEEIDFSADLNDWESLDQNTRTLVENVLAFFAGSDGIIFENINNNIPFCIVNSLATSRNIYESSFIHLDFVLIIQRFDERIWTRNILL